MTPLILNLIVGTGGVFLGALSHAVYSWAHNVVSVAKAKIAIAEQIIANAEAAVKKA